MAMRSPHGVFITCILAMSTAVASAGLATGAPSDSPDLRAFVTRQYVDGIPYHDAHAFGPQAVPELVSMLRDDSLEPHWSKIVFVLGAIGDPSAVEPLRSFLRRQRGEVSLGAFQAMLAVPPALGIIANGGDPVAFNTLVGFTKLNRGSNAIRGGYRRYRGSAMKEVLGRMAIQGLGLSGTAQASKVLEAMRADRKLRSDWRDNVADANALAARVQREGLDQILGGGHDQNR